MSSVAARRPWQPTPAQLLVIRLGVFLLCLLPLAQGLWDAFNAGLGVNPVETLIRRSGDWALRLLLVTLAISPLRRLSGQAWPMRLRRMLGLYAFFYACLHFGFFIVFEHALDPAEILADIAKRPFILAGFTALLLLLPLALTSTQGWMRRLGRRWKQLHRLVYPAALLAVLHYLLLNKSDDYREPGLYAAILALLLALRWRRGAGRRRSR